MKRIIINPWKVLAFLLILQVLVALLGRSISPLGVIIGNDLSLTKTQIGLLPTAFFVGQSLASIPSGILSDQIGSRKMFLLLTIMIGTGFIISTFLSHFYLFLFCIFIGGIGYGAMHPASNRSILYWFNSGKLGTAMGIKQTGITIGSALSALILLPLSSHFGWRIVLLITSIILITYGYIFYNLYYELHKEESRKNLKEFFASLVFVVKQKALVIISLCAAGLSAGQMIVNTYIVFYAYEYLGFGLVLAGFMLVISEVSGSAGRILWGIISDYIFNGNRVIVIIVITIITGAMSILLALMPNTTPFWLFLIFMSIFGFCVSGFNGIWMNVATEIVPKENSGASSGLSLMIGTMGVLIGPPVYGIILDYTGSFAYGWLYLSSLMLLVFIVLCYIRKTIDR